MQGDVVGRWVARGLVAGIACCLAALWTTPIQGRPFGGEVSPSAWGMIFFYGLPATSGVFLVVGRAWRTMQGLGWTSVAWLLLMAAAWPFGGCGDCGTAPTGPGAALLAASALQLAVALIVAPVTRAAILQPQQAS